MLRDVDDALRELFRANMTALGAGGAGGVLDTQIGFGPPDADWVSDVGALAPRRALNVFLADLRENRALRSNERRSIVDSGTAYTQPYPMRVDCHYIVSSWSPSTDRRTKTFDEHEVLSEALDVLAQARLLSVGGEDLPLAVAPPEGFGKLAEFWGTMGQKHRWKPVIPLVVTIPVESARELTGTAVTTTLTEYQQAGETRIQIGGTVLDANQVPVARAWVQIEDPAGAPLHATRTNAAGQFTFVDIPAGAYRLRVRADGHAEPPVVPITVPSPTGRYELSVQ
jgi:hypothetical protein